MSQKAMFITVWTSKETDIFFSLLKQRSIILDLAANANLKIPFDFFFLEKKETLVFSDR